MLFVVDMTLFVEFFVCVKGESDWNDDVDGTTDVSWWWEIGPFVNIRFRWSRPLTVKGCNGARKVNKLNQIDNKQELKRTLCSIIKHAR